jgi:archaellum biogenesis ATPase FlaH
MKAYEFLAKPENGVITIPKELKNRITSNVKVIVLEIKPDKLDDDKINTIRKSDLILPPTLDTRGWKFSREEANER